MLAEPTVENICRQFLMVHGYDGLCNPEEECGCGLDDLQPCGYVRFFDECRAGYRHADGLYYLSPEKTKA